MTERLIVEVGPWGHKWSLWIGGAMVKLESHQRTVEVYGREICRSLWQDRGIRSELRIESTKEFHFKIIQGRCRTVYQRHRKPAF